MITIPDFLKINPRGWLTKDDQILVALKKLYNEVSIMDTSIENILQQEDTSSLQSVIDQELLNDGGVNMEVTFPGNTMLNSSNTSFSILSPNMVLGHFNPSNTSILFTSNKLTASAGFDSDISIISAGQIEDKGSFIFLENEIALENNTITISSSRGPISCSTFFDGGDITNTASEAGNSTTLFQNPLNITVGGNTASGFKGVRYLEDYSANYLDRSLVDRAYVNGRFAAISSTSTNRFLNRTDSTIVATASGLTMTLPTAIDNTGKIYTIKLLVAGTVTVATTAGQTIDGAANAVLSTQYESITVQSTGTAWVII